MDTPSGAVPYRQAVEALWGAARIWDYLRYDAAGDLWINDLRVEDAALAFGTPLEIVDTTIVERRCAEWMALSRRVAAEVGYPGRLGYLYAAKANMASEITHAAYRSGWGAETSTVQDLDHLLWLDRQGLVPVRPRVVCNGFKLPPAVVRGRRQSAAPVSTVALPVDRVSPAVRGATYAERILEMAADGWEITPILDQGELGTFTAAGAPPMAVGLRLKFGRVTRRAALEGLVSRFGFEAADLPAAADAVAAAGHLRLTTLHAMVGAAETIPVEDFVASLVLAGEVWAQLRQRHPSLTELNMGGGVPPLSEPYDHRGFLAGLFGGLAAVSAAAGVPPPDLTFELGSLVAAESGFHVFKVLQERPSPAESPGAPAAWAMVDGGLMAAIPDMLLIGKPFRILAARGADAPWRTVRLGDLSCDSDGRYPPAAFGPEAGVPLPDGVAGQHVVIAGVGAYQEILAGVRGAHHCGLLEAVELIVERAGDGAVGARLVPRQTSRQAARLLGYGPDVVPALQAALAPPR